MTEANTFDNLLGLAGSDGKRQGGFFSKDFSPTGLPSSSHANSDSSVEAFYVHGIKSYKLNFLHGDGHVEFRSVPLSLGANYGNFFTGAWTSSAAMKDTDWNAL